jgi:hypothetical protein
MLLDGIFYYYSSTGWMLDCIVVLSLVCRWFAEEVGLCIDLALYLWQHKNFVWFFERMLLLVECVWFV